MKRLPYIDEHAITVAADREDTWSALLEVMCRDSHDPTTVPIGFVLSEARPPVRFALKGRHPFAVYRLVFELTPDRAGHTRLRALTWADFPGVHGKAYRALVIGSRAHRVVVRGMLKRIAAKAVREDGADYTDVFEAPMPPDDDRSAEQSLRDAVGDTPGAGGSVIVWIHRHILGFHLGPYSSPEHIIGWTIASSDHDEVVLTARGPVMQGRLTLRRQDGQPATLTTRVYYRHNVAARAAWAVVGPVHRVIAPRLVERTAAPRERFGSPAS
jgi:hypothetical protein